MSEKSGEVRFVLNKLVRDGVLDDMRVKGQQPEVSHLEGEAFLLALVEKLREEAAELDPTSPSFAKELVDLYEAVRQAAAEAGMSLDELEQLRQARHEEKGGFEGGQFVSELVLKADDSWVKYYRNEPDRFPEVR